MEAASRRLCAWDAMGRRSYLHRREHPTPNAKLANIMERTSADRLNASGCKPALLYAFLDELDSLKIPGSLPIGHRRVIFPHFEPARVRVVFDDLRPETLPGDFALFKEVE